MVSQCLAAGVENEVDKISDENPIVFIVKTTIQEDVKIKKTYKQKTISARAFLILYIRVCRSDITR